MDAKASKTNEAKADGKSRVVLTPRRWRQGRGAIRERRWQKSAVTGGEHEGNRNTVAQGMSDCSAYLW